MADKRSYEQIKLYQGYCKQLYNAGTIKIQLDGKEWVGDLKEYIHHNYKAFSKKAEFVSMARYLLKIMDLELPTKNPITSSNPNKNHFDVADMKDLTHHISWLREQLIYNHIEPFNG
jgi:hypothetical protein